MAHHSSEHDLTQRKLAEQLLNRTAGTDMQQDAAQRMNKMLDNLGATGEYPEGQYGPHDEGALRFAIGAENGKIIIDFGTPVRSIGLNPEDADAIIHSLMEKTRQARNQRK